MNSEICELNNNQANNLIAFPNENQADVNWIKESSIFFIYGKFRGG